MNGSPDDCSTAAGLSGGSAAARFSYRPPKGHVLPKYLRGEGR